MKRILLFNYEYPPLGGGAANATEQILRVFADDPDIVIDCVTSALGDEHEEIHVADNITVYRIPIGKNDENLTYQSKKDLIKYTQNAYSFAKTLIAKNAYDMTHSFFGVPCGVISLLLKWQYGIPYIVSLRGSDVPGYSDRFKALYTILTPVIIAVWKGAKHVVTNSKGLTELAQEARQKQVFLEIPNGIDTEHFTPGKRTADDRTKEFHILCAARLTHRKGFHYAILAFEKIVATLPHARLIIAGGDGGVAEKLKGQAQALSIQDRVDFLGHYKKEDALAIYQNADAFLMPSLNEGMSNNMLEALACGLPVLMTPTGGVDELVKDAKNGFIIKMKDADDIVEKVTLLAKDDALLTSMGRESRSIAEGMSWTHAAHAYKKLYGATKKV